MILYVMSHKHGGLTFASRCCAGMTWSVIFEISARLKASVAG